MPLPQHVYDEEEVAILERRLRERERAWGDGRVVDGVGHEHYTEELRQEIARLRIRLESSLEES